MLNFFQNRVNKGEAVQAIPDSKMPSPLVLLVATEDKFKENEIHRLFRSTRLRNSQILNYGLAKGMLRCK